MDTTIVVAIIVTGGTLAGGLLTSFLARQGARDLRANIEREIDIAKKLRPGSDEVALLEKHISSSISELIARDDRRAQRFAQMWLIGSLIVTLIALQAITFWREHGVWEPVRQPVEALYWVLWGFYLVVFVSIVLNGVKLGKQFLPFAARFSYFWAKTRLTRMKIVRLKIRLWRGERRVKKNERTIEQLQQRASNVEEQFEIRVAYTDYLLAFYDKRKDELIATHGEEKWAELRAGLLAQKKKAEEIRAEVQSIKARHDLDEDWSLLDEQTSLDDDRARELDEKP